MKHLFFFATLLLCLVISGCVIKPKKQPDQTTPSAITTAAPTVTPPAPSEESPMKVELPEDITTASFKQLWFVARQWAVGSYQEMVTKARNELARRGLAIIDDVMAEFPLDDSLEIEVFAAYFGALRADGVKPLATLFTKTDELKIQALQVISWIKLKEALPEMGVLLNDPNERIARYAAIQMAMLGDKSVVPILLARYNDPQTAETAKRAIIDALINVDDPELIPFYILACGDKSVIIRRIAQNALVGLGDKATVQIANAAKVAMLQHKRCLIESLGRIASAQSQISLETYLSSEDWRIRLTTIIAYGHAADAKKLVLEFAARLKDMERTETHPVCKSALARFK